MILDERTEFADASTDIQAATGTVNLGDVVDTSLARDLGNGQPVYVVFQVDTEIDSAGDAATVQWQIASDGTGTIATDGNQTIHLLTDALVEGDLAAGATFVYTLPSEGVVYEQFLGVQAVIAGETITAGAVNVFLTLDQHGWKSYADASN